MTHIFRYLTPIDDGPMVGVRDDAGLYPLDVLSLGALLASPAGDIRAAVEDAGKTAPITEQPVLLPPADGRMEIWAAGVTYTWHEVNAQPPSCATKGTVTTPSWPRL